MTESTEGTTGGTGATASRGYDDLRDGGPHEAPPLDSPDARTAPEVDEVRAADEPDGTGVSEEPYELNNVPEADTGTDDDPASQLNY